MDKATKLEAAQQAIGYRFNDPNLLWEALQASGSGVVSIDSRTVVEGNKQLALVGDKVLALHLALIGREQGERVEQINDRISARSRNARLQEICDGSGLTACIQNNPSQGGVVQPRTKTATVEAVVAAAHCDGGMPAAQTVMLNLGFV
ncbi:hypothetical protein DL769_011489 [Monosporascus sp. CRB-8-3]|nr:hypothetical protein DL769_011489 [Monosporascus sp. CRB-8-3]